MKERFERFLSEPDANGCRNWLGGVRNRYGAFKIKGKSYGAHRVAYELYKGPIPAGLVVRHRCDNRRCCAPSHLELGTQQDNLNDMKARKRHRCARGQSHAMSKLTEEQVIAIRADKRTCRVIASEYAISSTQVSTIKTRKQWRQV